jgi:cytoskeletal protein CcmA (bactofilin family)
VPSEPRTRLGRTLIISGDISSDEDIVVDGQVRGYIHLHDATLTIGEYGRVEAEVRAAQVLVRGHLRGAVAATRRIELTPSAHVAGSLSANQVVVADGARFTGQVDMDRRTIAARVAQYRAAAR